MVKVHVEYCTSCSYQDKYANIKQVLEERIPGIEVVANEKPSRKCSFEITCDKSRIPLFSKLATNKFPTNEDLEKIIVQLQQTK